MMQYMETKIGLGSMLEFTGADMTLQRKRDELERGGYGRKGWVLSRAMRPEHKVKGQK